MASVGSAGITTSEGSKSSTHYLSDKNRFDVSSKGPLNGNPPLDAIVNLGTVRADLHYQSFCDHSIGKFYGLRDW